MTASDRWARERADSGLCVVDYGDLMAREFPKRERMLGPWLLRQTLAMVYGWRGIGKSHFSLGVAFAAATGTKFLRWDAPSAVNVLFVDGELPAPTLQERLHAIEASVGVKPEPGRFNFITPDLLPRAAPDLGSVDDQFALDEMIKEKNIDLIILDNLSALVRSGAAENDAESWVGVSSWALQHRAQGRSVLFVHHAGKGGAQRGTSRREDLLDVVICLKKPPDYTPDEGARFECHFQKARHLFGDEVEPFEAGIQTDAHGRQCWAITDLENTVDDRIVELHGLKGMTMTDIAREIGCNKSTVSRRIGKLKDEGRIEDSPAKKDTAAQRDKHTKKLI